jgi:hypothetical protein
MGTTPVPSVHFMDANTELPLCSGERDPWSFNWTLVAGAVTCDRCRGLLPLAATPPPPPFGDAPFADAPPRFEI